MWIIAPEVGKHYGDFKKVDTAIGTGPFVLEHYEPNVRLVFKRNPDYFREGLPYVDGVEWLVQEDESTGLAMYRAGQLDTGPGGNWQVRQVDLEALQKSHPHLHYQDMLAVNAETIWMRTDQPPFNDVRVRRAISQAIDRQAILEAVYMRGEPTPAIPRGLAEWSLPIDQLGEGAKYYQYDPKEAKRLLAEAGHPKGLKTPFTVSSGYGRDLIDAAQLDLLSAPLLTPFASHNPLLLQSLPTSSPCRLANARRRKDDTRVGIAARGIVQRLYRVP
jgi:peptide/nickel transport system substrate-binding protein